MAPERRGRTLLHSPRAPHGVPHRSIARQKILTGGSIHMYGRHGIRAIRRVIERLDFALTAGRWKPIIRIPCYRANRGISGAREDPSSGLRQVVAPPSRDASMEKDNKAISPPCVYASGSRRNATAHSRRCSDRVCLRRRHREVEIAAGAPWKKPHLARESHGGEIRIHFRICAPRAILLSQTSHRSARLLPHTLMVGGLGACLVLRIRCGL